MRKIRTLVSWVLCITMMLTLAMPFSANVFAAEESTVNQDVTGSITATLRFDYPQLTENIKERGITAVFSSNTAELGSVELDGTKAVKIGGYDAQVTAKNLDGAPLTTEAEIGYFDIVISGLPLGEYTFRFSGKGYTAYTTPKIKLDDYSQQVIIGTGDATFTIGDVNLDGKVDSTDRKLLSDALGKQDAESLKNCDFNGDGKIDIIDLAYVNHQIGAVGDAEMIDTTLIAQRAINVDATKATLTVDPGQDIESLFRPDGEAVKLSTKDNSELLIIPVEFKENSGVEMEEINIVSPAGVDGGVVAGSVGILLADGTEETYHFDNSAPAEVNAIETRDGSNRVVIPLGKRVAVKKIIIRVDTVIGQDNEPKFAVIEEIQFLKNIVPENPVNVNNKVKNVKAEPLNESVKLTWSEFPNIMGYRIYYGEQPGDYSDQMEVQTTTATVTGLENLKPYYFTVAPISEGWEGGLSDEISAIPQPNSVPKKPDMVVVKGEDRALRVSWKKAENAVYYEVYYKEANSTEDYKQFGGQITDTSTAIGGLTNGIEYNLYIIAGNNIGKGPRSNIAVGIPQKDEVDAPDIPTKYMIDKSNIEKIELGNTSNVMTSEYPNGFDVWNVADGDYGTHWTAATWSKSGTFTFTFKEAKEMNYMVYVPRLDGNYRKSLETYAITVWDEDGNQTNFPTKRIVINSGTTGYMILPFERTKVKKLAVAVNQWAGSPTNRSLAEAVFYEADNLAEGIRALFANDTYTELVEGVTPEQIEAFRAEANDAEGYYVNKNILLDELALAEALLKGDSSALGLMVNGIESRNSGADSSQYKQSGSDFQPLGAVAYATDYAEGRFAETKVTIYADIPEGENVVVVPTQHYAEANAWQGGGITLQSGRNEITIPRIGSGNSERGGSLYLKYSGSRPQDIKLHVRQGITAIPTLKLTDWDDLDEAARKARITTYIEALTKYTQDHKNQMNQTGIHNSTELSLPTVLLSIPASQVLAAIKPTGADIEAAAQNLYNNVLAWKEIISICNTTQGIEGPMQSRQNIRYMQMFGSAFMYAAGSHVGIGYGSCGGMVSGKPVASMTEGAQANNLFGWGIAHEIGHNMDKLGKAEITNNIYSLMVQTYDGNQNTLPSRLEKSNKYTKIYDKVSAGRPGASNDVFVQLGMYWQLHLAYDEGEEPMAFYNQLYKKWKSGAHSGVSSDDRFALIASEVANKNLTDYFTAWGMQLSDSTKEALKAYPSEPRKVQYMNDDSRRYRLAGGAAGAGTTTATAALSSTDEKTVEISISNTDPNTVLGYEILRNGKPLAFVTDTSYSDVIGSANNMAFTYEVQAIDKLGNPIDTAQAGQVRISYDKTVDPSLYQMTTAEDGTITVQAKDGEFAVSGIKVSNAPAEGEFTVDIKHADATEFVTAKNGNFTANEAAPDKDYYLSYFNKPGTNDTRIWTFDAAEIKITGVQSDATVEFISYPGDNIAFYEGASAGILESDYVYGDGENDVIKAGTLIITGTYRGDPVYNTIRIVGKYPYRNIETDEENVAERPLDGYALLFAEIPEDGAVSDISDGIFIFVPEKQEDTVWEEMKVDCGGENLLPAEIKAELYRTDDAESAESKRLTSDTIWISTPGGAELPTIALE